MEKALITYDLLREVLKRLGYKWYSGTYNLNFIGIRATNRRANRFDDLFALAYQLPDGSPDILVISGTTDPGNFYLMNPMDPKGCAIVKPGQYFSLWAPGLHRGEYPALVQVNPVSIYRDNDRDVELDLDPSTFQIGEYGINFHKKKTFSETVDQGSAGCQVAKYVADFNRVMELAGKQMASGYGSKITYTLLDEADL